jgi:hypothetical protein
LRKRFAHALHHKMILWLSESHGTIFDHLDHVGLLVQDPQEDTTPVVGDAIAIIRMQAASKAAPAA